MTRPSDTDFRVLQELIRAAGGGGQPIHTDVEAVEYDWNVPSHFSREQLEQLCQFGGSMADGLSKALGEHLREEMAMVADPVGQQFRHRLADQLGHEGDFRITLGIEDEPLAVLILAGSLAVGWVAALLGASGGGEADKELSDLEASLLDDTVAVVIEAISSALQEAGGAGVQRIGDIRREPVELPGDDDTECCTLFFKSDESQEQANLRLVTLCGVLDPAVGREGEDADRPEATSGPDSRSTMTEHFARASVTAVAMVGQAELTMRDVMALEAGDVILLPKTVREPIELQVAGEVVSLGRTVTCRGQYAVQITEAASGGGFGRAGAAQLR